MLEQGTFCFKYIPRMYGVFKAHLIQSRKEGGNALCLTGKQNTRALPQNFAENDTGDNRITGEMPLQEKFIPSDGFFAVSLALSQLCLINQKHVISMGQNFFDFFLIHQFSSFSGKMRTKG